METKENLSKGITLVALVITIVILLILAGISIQSLTNTGLFDKANEAKKQSEMANVREQVQLEIYAKQAESTGEITQYELKSILEKYGTVNYEEDGTTIKGITTAKGYEIALSDIYSGGLSEEKLVANGTWQNVKKVNSPELLTGMTPIKFTEPEDNKEGTTEKTTYTDKNWYDYTAKKWANTQTEDGSMWVWIPRYAYKINSSTQTCDIVFLIGTTDNYYDENGKIQTAKRQKTTEETIDTTIDYTVHPAFTNESSINYANGGWDKELSGIWVAKFEAGYAGGNNSAPKGISSEVKYTQSSVWGASNETGTGKTGSISARNWTDGIYGATETTIKYPTFQGLTYSMNYINHNDAYRISKVLTESGNIYGLNSSSTDSHLMKNSEWGAVSYLSQSKYGLDGTDIVINSVYLNNTTKSVYAVTGCASSTADASAVSTTIGALNNRTQSGVYVWTQKNGTAASSTGTIYGIYDMSGGAWEYVMGVYNKTISSSGFSSLPDTKYYNNYTSSSYTGHALDETAGWYSDDAYFPNMSVSWFLRGGHYGNSTIAGVFDFHRGNCQLDSNYSSRFVITNE